MQSIDRMGDMGERGIRTGGMELGSVELGSLGQRGMVERGLGERSVELGGLLRQHQHADVQPRHLQRGDPRTLMPRR